MALDDIIKQHDGEVDALVNHFKDQLEKMLAKAQANVQATLTSKLTFDDRGKIEQTSSNRSQLRRMDDMLNEELDELGLQDLIDAFVHQFGGQFKYFKQVLEQTLGKARADKLDALKFTVDDQKVFSMMQADAAENLEDIVGQAGDDVRRRTLMGMGGMTARDLAETMTEVVAKTAGYAKTEATTAVSSFYRTLAKTSFQKIEEDDDWEITYRYVGPGPLDPVERPFCRHLMTQSLAGRTWTYDQIEDMDNDQLDDVFVTGGGYNCRHQWIVADMRPSKKQLEDAD